MRALTMVAAGLVSFACSPGGGGDGGVAVGDAGVTRIILEIATLGSAAPFGAEAQHVPNAFLKTNLVRLGKSRGDSVSLPTQTSEFLVASGESRASYRKDELLALGEATRRHHSDAQTIALLLLWVPGVYHDGAAERPEVLAASFGSTGVIAVFKPAIEAGLSSSNFPRAQASLVEQAVVLHEVGHALGLVGRTLPLTTAHRDDAHGNHCTDPTCLMFWTNESFSSLGAFVEKYAADGRAVVFDAACLADVDQG